MNGWLLLLAIITALNALVAVVTALIQAVAAWFGGPIPPIGRKLLLIAMIVCFILAVAFGSATYVTSQSSPTLTSSSTSTVPDSSPTVQLGAIPTSTLNVSPMLQPTATATLEPTPTVATSVPDGSYQEHIRLSCKCSDPVVVTITKITIQQAQNKMIWSLTFYNNSPNNTRNSFDQFYLEDGDQVQYPTSGAQTYEAAGQAVNTEVDVSPGATQSIIITFSFVPDTLPYTLISRLAPCAAFCNDIPFDPKVIQFGNL
ncbi:MAG TPA: hypothetical protein VFV38_28760 [Ktedonobacteraceae bacterium]|nr:hypothetical protein [Ktedonobacteraceae bacterium]